MPSLRPWDLSVDPLGRDALRPFKTIGELEDKVSAIYHRVDPELGGYFDFMRQHNLLDLENRKGKAPGAYCNNYDLVRQPFIFENAVGMEIAEVASMAMELLASPYLLASEGGFYSEKEAARARIEHLEEQVLFWPYMAVVDAFQHWAYTNSEDAIAPENCDQKWAELWRHYMVAQDWSGLDDEMVTGWQRKQHIFEVPFYYVEYGAYAANLSPFRHQRSKRSSGSLPASAGIGWDSSNS